MLYFFIRGFALKGLHVGFSGKVIWLVALMVLLALTGCHRRQIEPDPGRKLPYKVTGASDPATIKLQARIEKEGAQVITLGQDYLISVPSYLLFAYESPQIKWSSYSILGDVACYLKQFHKVSITVTAFSSKSVSIRREHALTLARARAVANYLWSQGIDSRFVFTQGLASDKPIVAYKRGGDRSPNSRVEISFRDAIA